MVVDRKGRAKASAKPSPKASGKDAVKSCDTCGHMIRRLDSGSLRLCNKATHPFNQRGHPFADPKHPQHDPKAKRAASVAWQDCWGRHWEPRA